MNVCSLLDVSCTCSSIALLAVGRRMADAEHDFSGFFRADRNLNTTLINIEIVYAGSGPAGPMPLLWHIRYRYIHIDVYIYISKTTLKGHHKY